LRKGNKRQEPGTRKTSKKPACGRAGKKLKGKSLKVMNYELCEIVMLIRILNPGLKEKGLQSRQGQSSMDKG